MSMNLDTLSATAALVGSLGIHSMTTEAAPVPLTQAARSLRAAQVELYCDHDAAALVALREARRALPGLSNREQSALAAMDEAAWHIRRDDPTRALIAIDSARAVLA